MKRKVAAAGGKIPDRYLRQAGLLDQGKLRGSEAIVVGVGGLGGVAAHYLALAGVKKLTLIDRDVVEESNLNRQALFTEKDMNHPKAEVAARRLADMNPSVEVVPIVEDAEKLQDQIGADCILDCTDNMEARLLVNRIAVEKRIPLVFGAAVGWQGAVAAMVPGGFCLACIYGAKKERDILSCERAGIVGPVAGAVGCVQAIEALKILGTSEKPKRGMMYFDFLASERWFVRVRKDPECKVCGSRASAKEAGARGGRSLEAAALIRSADQDSAEDKN